MQNNNYKIYTLSHPVTNEIRYVGFTTLSLKERLQTHIYDSKKRNTYTYNWFKKLKKENLIPKIELLEECDIDNWRILESYWIYQLKAWGFNLTNLAEGGMGNPIMDTERKRKISEKLKGKPSWNKGIPCSKEAKKKISQANKGRKKSRESIEKIVKKTSKPVVQFDKNGNKINEFKNGLEAERKYGFSNSTINQCCNGKQKSCGGYYWFFKNSYNENQIIRLIKKLNKISNTKCVLQYDLKTGMFIKEYKSVTEAAKYNNVNKSQISACCLKKLHSSTGYVWKYKNKKGTYPQKLKLIKSGNRIKKIIQYDLKNKKIKEWKSLTDASKFLNIPITSISMCCRDVIKTTHNFIFKFKKKISKINF